MYIIIPPKLVNESGNLFYEEALFLFGGLYTGRNDHFCFLVFSSNGITCVSGDILSTLIVVEGRQSMTQTNNPPLLLETSILYGDLNPGIKN